TESQHQRAIVRKKLPGGTKTLQSVDVVVKPDRGHACQQGVRVKIAEHNQVVLLARLSKKGSCVIDEHCDTRRVVGMLWVKFSTELQNYRINFYCIDMQGFVPECSRHIVPGSRSDDQYPT